MVGGAIHVQTSKLQIWLQIWTAADHPNELPSDTKYNGYIFQNGAYQKLYKFRKSIKHLIIMRERSTNWLSKEKNQLTFGLEYILIKVGRLELRIKGSGSSISILINLPNQQNTNYMQETLPPSLEF